MLKDEIVIKHDMYRMLENWVFISVIGKLDYS